MTKVDAVALRAKYQGKIAGLEEKTRQGVDVAEIGAGAAMAGYLDIVAPSLMGIPSSAAAGIALFVAGSIMEQRDVQMLGTGLLAGSAYKQGQTLALGVTKETTAHATNAKTAAK